MKNLNAIFLILILVILTSCSNDEGIEQVNLNGTVLGESFEAVGGKALTVGNNLLITISNESANCNSDITSHSSYLVFEVPKGTGPYADIALTFSGSGKNSIEYSSATIIISAIKENTITGQIAANLNNENRVEGYFVVSNCE